MTLPTTTPGQRRAGLALTVLVALFLALDAGMKLLALPVVRQTQSQLGWSGDASHAVALGLVMAVCLALYLIPRTAVLGALLLTAYLGGAVATHARIGSPLATHTLFGVYVGVAVWAALWLRQPALRALLPIRTGEPA